MEVVEPLSKMFVVSTTHDVTSMGNEINGATNLDGQGQMEGEGWICTELKWRERSVPGDDEA